LSAPHPRRVMLYGCNGYTARLLLPRLLERGVDVVLAGRSTTPVERLGAEYGFPTRAFDLRDPRRIDLSLGEISLVINAAGPFCETAPPLIDACLRRRVDYVDLSGELDSIAYAARSGSMAADLGVMLLPAIGFDVAASDCLAVHLAEKLPGAESLVLGISPSSVLSRGSAITMARNAGNFIVTRRSGALRAIRWQARTRRLDFGEGERSAIAVTWGDLVTAFHSTRIPDIEVYFEATPFWLVGVTANQLAAPLWRVYRPLLEELARTMPAGPSDAERARERCIVFGEVRQGERCERARLVTSEAYTFTADVAVRVVAQILGGTRRAGFTTPASLLGPDFVLGIAGVRREALQ
jgi:short subunit dehydrogenase-like uncharacterized protein